jgi:hypothetical protein
MHAHHHHRSAAVAMFANGTYFLDNTHILHVRDYSSVYLSIHFIADADVLS